MILSSFCVPQHVLDFASKQFVLDVDGHHGHRHWHRVTLNGEMLAELNPEVDPVVVAHFAVLHDCCRVNEDEDEGHGERAVLRISELLLDLSHLRMSQVTKLLEAITGHSNGKRHPDPTIGTCWDADRLDLDRVGITPSRAYMSTYLGLELCTKRFNRTERADHDW